MPAFALMTELAPAEVKNPSLRAQRGRRWMAGEVGASAAESWTLIPSDRYLKLTRSM